MPVRCGIWLARQNSRVAMPQAGLGTEHLPEGLRHSDSATHRFHFNSNSFALEWQDREITAAGVNWQPLLYPRAWAG